MNIELIIAIAAFVLSLTSWIYMIYMNRKDVSLIINRYTSYRTEDLQKESLYMMSVSFENKSRQPIAISKLAILQDDVEYDFRVDATIIFKGALRTGDRVDESNEISSTQFPINLSPLNSCHAYTYVTLPSDCVLPVSTPLTFAIYTNRGVVKQMIHELQKAHVDKNKFLSVRSR